MILLWGPPPPARPPLAAAEYICVPSSPQCLTVQSAAIHGLSRDILTHSGKCLPHHCEYTAFETMREYFL
jgi:hypothetical protein